RGPRRLIAVRFRASAKWIPSMKPIRNLAARLARTGSVQYFVPGSERPALEAAIAKRGGRATRIAGSEIAFCLLQARRTGRVASPADQACAARSLLRVTAIEGVETFT